MTHDECIEAQRVLNEASDGIPVDAEALRQAKAHCAACAGCLSFISGLAALKKTPEPVAPERLANRVIASVNEEAERIEAEETAAAALAAEAAASADADTTTPVPTDKTAATLEARNWKMWAPWAAAGVIVLIIAGIGMMQGARFIAGVDDSGTITPSATSQDAAPPTGSSSAEDATSGEGARAIQETEGAEDAEYVSYGEHVYTLVGTTQQPSETATGGVVVSALDTDEPAQSHPVFADTGLNTIIVFDGSDYLEFDIVTRKVKGETYAMVAKPVDAFGMWPLPPVGLPMPTNEDGSPYFRAGGTDGNGVVTYVPADEYPREGIAIAPGTAERDPAAGNPNWTWWEPLENG